jgi:hypothetical protein
MTLNLWPYHETILHIRPHTPQHTPQVFKSGNIQMHSMAWHHSIGQPRRNHLSFFTTSHYIRSPDRFLRGTPQRRVGCCCLAKRLDASTWALRHRPQSDHHETHDIRLPSLLQNARRRRVAPMNPEKRTPLGTSLHKDGA